jgi:LL-diaminopimelate aminotransferase
LLDLGVGEPDWMADEQVVAALVEQSAEIANRGYADNGCFPFKQAVAQYMEQVFGVAGLDPATEINHCMGSKSALAMLPSAFIHRGDITLMTTPGYPIIGTHTEWLGGVVVHLPLEASNDFVPNLQAIPPDIRKRAKLLYLNYPNNPTGACATKAFYEEVVQFAYDNQVIVVSDEAYGALTYDGERPLSFLSIEGAKEVGVSIQSLSKAFNMTGWRLGYVAGNELVVRAFAAVKDHYDSGQFLPIQYAAVQALRHPEITQRTVAKYSRRLDLLVATLSSLGFQATKPRGSFFLYVEAPRGITGGPVFETAEAFSIYLLEQKLISTVPWDDTGRYVRWSVTYSAHESEEVNVMNELYVRLAGVPFEWR